MSLKKSIRIAFSVLLFGPLATFSQDPPLLGAQLKVPVVTGQVIINDGTRLSESVPIEIACAGRVRAEFYSDMQGHFDFDLSRLEGPLIPQSADVTASAQSVNVGSMWNDCVARATLAGFSSDSIDLARNFHELGVVNIGKIRLHPVNPGAKASLSVSSLLAPKSAKKAMEKGLSLEQQKKWPQAEESFHKAIDIYPGYAAAWSELGRMQYIQRDFPSARESFHRSVEIDPQYVKPYLGLVQLAMDSHNWPELVRTTDQALALDSASYPAVWLMNAAAQYNLHNYDAAEASVRNGKRADTEHRIGEFHTLWMKIISARSEGTAFVGQSPHIRFGTNRRVWENNDPTSIWLR